MKIFWVINVIFPEIAQEIGKEKNVYGGWIQQFKKSLCEDDKFELTICSFEQSISSVVHRKIGNTGYYLVPKKKSEAHKYDSSIEGDMKKILSSETPDVIHVWGTEYPHALTVSKVANELNIKTIFSIQGLIGDCAKHYLNGLSILDICKCTFRDFVRMDNIFFQKKKFEKRGEFERELLSKAENVIGRTSYDYAGVKEINPDITYYFCNECLRDSFYSSKWELEQTEKNTIFISQASYPIKGFHYFLEGLKIVKERYPDVKVYIAGGFNPYAYSVKDKLRQGTYTKCIVDKIKRYGLRSNLVFMGSLSETQMKEAMLNVRVFVSPSLVENSSNSVGEAMLLGTPVVSSYVGGIRDMIEDKKSGLLYPVDQPNVMAQMIMQMFDDDALANDISQNAREKAKQIYDIKVNTDRMKLIYKMLAMKK